MSNNNLELIVSIVSKHIKEDIKNIDINSKADDFYKWDSLSQINIILEIEKKISKKIEASKISELTSIKSILNYLK
jgi:acyl carrier protein